MTDLISFTFEQAEVRVIERDNQPWWVASDIAAILGYRNAPDMVRNLDDDEAATQNVRSSGQSREMLIISESGLYNAIFRARRPEAREFRRWVTGTVLPALRRSGSYSLSSSNCLDRLEQGLQAHSHVTTAEAAALAGIVADNEGQAATAGLLRALGWRRVWTRPVSRLEA